MRTVAARMLAAVRDAEAALNEVNFTRTGLPLEAAATRS